MPQNARHIIALSVTAALLAGCQMQGPTTATAEGQPSELYVQNLDLPTDKYGEDKAEPAVKAAAKAAASPEIEALLQDRSAEYERVAREARTKGIAGGVIRGGIIGLLIDADPATVVGGAVVGGLIGAASADKVVSEIVTEHRNYLLRRWSLEKVIEAAKTDTENTRFDLLLSDRYLAEREKLAFADQDSSVDALNNFKSQALNRAMALREVMPIYATSDEARLALEAELSAQTVMVKKLEANLARLGAEG